MENQPLEQSNTPIASEANQAAVPAQNLAPAPTPENKKTSPLSAVIYILIGVAIAVGAYFIVTAVLNSTDNSKKEETTIETAKEYKTEDYIKLSTHTETGVFNDTTASVSYDDIEFQNLSEDLYADFTKEHKKLTGDKACTDTLVQDGIECSMGKEGKISASIDGSILSVYEDVVEQDPNGEYSNRNVLNIDLEAMKKISDTDLLEKYGVDTTTVHEKIILNLVDTVSIDRFLNNVEGIINDDTTSVATMKEKYQDYAKKLDGKDSDLKLTYFIKNSKLYVSYVHNDVLKVMGMGQHMGAGLEGKAQEVQLSE